MRVSRFDGTASSAAASAIVADAGEPTDNGTYLFDSVVDGKSAYKKDGGVAGIVWNSGTARWEIRPLFEDPGIVDYRSSTASAEPWDANPYTVDLGLDPAPTVTEG